MKRILFVDGRLASGRFTYAGKEKMIQWLGNSLSEIGYEVTFCTTYDKTKSDKMNDKVIAIPLRYKYHDSFLVRNVIFFLRYPFSIIRVLRDKKYDFVVSFGDTSFFILVLLKWFFSYKLVVSERADPYSNSSFLDKFRRSLYQFSDFIVFQTNGAQRFFGNRILNKSFVIPNPVDIPDECWNYSITREEVACVGRIDFFQKRQDLLCRAFKLVLRKYPIWKLNIYGTGQDMEKLEGVIQELGLTNNVILHGAIKNVNEQLLKNRLFVLTSDFEGIPNALLEAMALGMPVVSTDCSPGGAAMLIENGKNGFLVPRGNEIEISNAICNLIENPQNSICMGRQARNDMSHYSEEKIMEMWNKVFAL